MTPHNAGTGIEIKALGREVHFVLVVTTAEEAKSMVKGMLAQLEKGGGLTLVLDPLRREALN